MDKAYSKINPRVLLYQIIRRDDIASGLASFSDSAEFLQVRGAVINPGAVVAPHRHVWKEGEKQVITQECWVVIAGQVRGTFYDLDHQIINDVVLGPGDCAVMFQGGHSLIGLDQDAIIYEIKTGPYKGKELDKVEIPQLVSVGE